MKQDFILQTRLRAVCRIITPSLLITLVIKQRKRRLIFTIQTNNGTAEKHRHRRDHMVVGITATRAISAYHH